MEGNQKIIGPVTVNLPDENDNYFSLFEDCAELFGEEFQKNAFRLLKAKLTDIKPKPAMDYEGDYVHITTSNSDTIAATIGAIIELCTAENQVKFPKLDIEELKAEFAVAKKNRPKPRLWSTGDVFSVPLLNGTFSFGQVLDKKYCTCALFNIQSGANTLTAAGFKDLRAISVLHLSTGNMLNNGQWQVLFNEQVVLDPNSGRGKKFGDVGSTSYGGCGVMADLANAFWGLSPWNIMGDEDYYDQLLLKGVQKPATAKVLSAADRKQYRIEKYGIDDEEII